LSYGKRYKKTKETVRKEAQENIMELKPKYREDLKLK
jgi:hypothetical protein